MPRWCRTWFIIAANASKHLPAMPSAPLLLAACVSSSNESMTREPTQYAAKFWIVTRRSRTWRKSWIVLSENRTVPWPFASK